MSERRCQFLGNILCEPSGGMETIIVAFSSENVLEFILVTYQNFIPFDIFNKITPAN